MMVVESGLLSMKASLPRKERVYCGHNSGKGNRLLEELGD